MPVSSPAPSSTLALGLLGTSEPAGSAGSARASPSPVSIAVFERAIGVRARLRVVVVVERTKKVVGTQQAIGVAHCDRLEGVRLVDASARTEEAVSVIQQSRY